MRKFLSLCLLGTAITGWGVSANAGEYFGNGPVGWFEDALRGGSRKASTSQTTRATTSSSNTSRYVETSNKFSKTATSTPSSSSSGSGSTVTRTTTPTVMPSTTTSTSNLTSNTAPYVPGSGGTSNYNQLTGATSPSVTPSTSTGGISVPTTGSASATIPTTNGPLVNGRATTVITDTSGNKALYYQAADGTTGGKLATWDSKTGEWSTGFFSDLSTDNGYLVNRTGGSYEVLSNSQGIFTANYEANTGGGTASNIIGTGNNGGTTLVSGTSSGSGGTSNYNQLTGATSPSVAPSTSTGGISVPATGSDGATVTPTTTSGGQVVAITNPEGKGVSYSLLGGHYESGTDSALVKAGSNATIGSVTGESSFENWYAGSSAYDVYGIKDVSSLSGEGHYSLYDTSTGKMVGYYKDGKVSYINNSAGSNSGTVTTSAGGVAGTVTTPAAGGTTNFSATGPADYLMDAPAGLAPGTMYTAPNGYTYEVGSDGYMVWDGKGGAAGTVTTSAAGGTTNLSATGPADYLMDAPAGVAPGTMYTAPNGYTYEVGSDGYMVWDGKAGTGTGAAAAGTTISQPSYYANAPAEYASVSGVVVYKDGHRYITAGDGTMVLKDTGGSTLSELDTKNFIGESDLKSLDQAITESGGDIRGDTGVVDVSGMIDYNGDGTMFYDVDTNKMYNSRGIEIDPGTGKPIRTITDDIQITNMDELEAAISGAPTEMYGTVTDIDGDTATVTINGKKMELHLEDKGNLELGDNVKVTIEPSLYSQAPQSVSGGFETAGMGQMDKSAFYAQDGTKYTRVDNNIYADDNGVKYKVSDDGQSLTKLPESEQDAKVTQESPRVEQQKQQSEEAKKSGEDAKDKAQELNPLDTANVTNAIQYAVLILQALEGNNQKDATKNVTVKGAEELQKSQGNPGDSQITPSSSLDGSTLSCAANSLALLLQQNSVDISLLNTDNFDPTVTADKIEMQNQYNQVLQQYAVSAETIAEGSNAISSQFYSRVRGLAAAAGKSTSGTLGAMSVVNDSERYPYFEMVRQVALSGVQLGLKGVSVLGDLVVHEQMNDEKKKNPDDE